MKYKRPVGIPTTVLNSVSLAPGFLCFYNEAAIASPRSATNTVFAPGGRYEKSALWRFDAGLDSDLYSSAPAGSAVSLYRLRGTHLQK
jgi:hypothetical protein